MRTERLVLNLSTAEMAAIKAAAGRNKTGPWARQALLDVAAQRQSLDAILVRLNALASQVDSVSAKAVALEAERFAKLTQWLSQLFATRPKSHQERTPK